MKKIFYKVAQTGAFMRVFAMALSLGIVAGCDNGDDNDTSDIFAGTWEGRGYLASFNEDGDWKITAKSGSFQVYLTDDCAANNLEVAHGIYTYAGSKVIMTITQTLEWWHDQQCRIVSPQWQNFGATITLTIVNESITLDGVTFNKKGDNKPDAVVSDDSDALIGTWCTDFLGQPNAWEVEFLSDKSFKRGGYHQNDMTWSASGGKIKFQVIPLQGVSQEIGTADYVIKEGSLIISDITSTIAGGETAILLGIFAPYPLTLPVTYVKKD